MERSSLKSESPKVEIVHKRDISDSSNSPKNIQSFQSSDETSNTDTDKRYLKSNKLLLLKANELAKSDIDQQPKAEG